MEASRSDDNNSRFDVHGKTILVTGATQGIGNTLARSLRSAGAEVIVHGKEESAAKSVAREIGAGWVSSDFTEPDAIEELAAQVREITSVVDVLINNAGYERVSPIESTSEKMLRDTLRINVEAPMLLTRALLTELRNAEGAAVINMTSIHESVPYPHNAAYSMSKAALSMFTKTAAVELAEHGIRVNNLAPGAIETEMNREVLEEIGKDRFSAWIPAGRVGTTDDLVGAVLFLASDSSRYVTGSSLYADGGYSQNLVRYRP